MLQTVSRRLCGNNTQFPLPLAACQPPREGPSNRLDMVGVLLLPGAIRDALFADRNPMFLAIAGEPAAIIGMTRRRHLMREIVQKYVLTDGQPLLIGKRQVCFGISPFVVFTELRNLIFQRINTDKRFYKGFRGRIMKIWQC